MCGRPGLPNGHVDPKRTCGHKPGTHRAWCPNLLAWKANKTPWGVLPAVPDETLAVWFTNAASNMQRRAIQFAAMSEQDQAQFMTLHQTRSGRLIRSCCLRPESRAVALSLNTIAEQLQHEMAAFRADPDPAFRPPSEGESVSPPWLRCSIGILSLVGLRRKRSSAWQMSSGNFWARRATSRQRGSGSAPLPRGNLRW